ncbi:MAG: hypothetical protein E7028_05000 [Planctomycetaceae bacterium]|nr:hypothetical protein [Planctomycetaceae bacterium]
MYWSVYKSIFFVEGMPQNCHLIANISTQTDNQNCQLKSFDEVKEKMIKLVLRYGGNSIVDFEYGQKLSKRWFSRDGIAWYGSGIVALINPARLPETND